jgi:hypothetical protein
MFMLRAMFYLFTFMHRVMSVLTFSYDFDYICPSNPNLLELVVYCKDIERIPPPPSDRVSLSSMGYG